MNHTVSRRTLLKATSLTTTAGALAALVGCGVGAENTAHTGATPAAGTGTPSATSAPTSWTLPDPRSLTGLSTAEAIEDITPISQAPTPTLPVTLTDADSTQVTVSDVSRIIALDLYGTLSRTVEGLGLGANIVARGQSSTENSLAHLPVVVQNGLEINVEAVLSLAPTVILVDHSLGPVEAFDQLRAAGTPVVVLNPARTLDSIESDIAAVAQALGLDEQAQALSQRSRQEVTDATATITQWVPDKPLRAAFLYVRGTGNVFFVLGKGHGADILIDALGCQDIATEAGMGDTTPATAEALASLNPEVIFTMTGGLESTGGLDAFLARPGIAQTTAGANSRIVAIPDGQALTFGPQSGAVLLSAARALYQPEPA